MTRRGLALLLVSGSVASSACSLLDPTGYLQAGRVSLADSGSPDAGGDGTAPCVPDPDPVHLVDAIALVAAGGHTCALRANQEIACWGDNLAGQTGGVDGAATVVPATVQLPAQAAGISAGGRDSCALTTKGAVWCWGAADIGELGPSVDTFAAVPLPHLIVSADGGAFAAKAPLAAGHDHVCAIGDTGDVGCWGRAEVGELGVSPASPPAFGAVVTVPSTHDTTLLATGGQHSCAVSSGRLVCWGSGGSGELAQAADSGLTQSVICADSICTWNPTPAQLPAGLVPPVTALALGGQPEDYTCALDASGALFCWGAYASGQTGSTSFAKIGVMPPQPHPVVELPVPTQAVAAGLATTCALGTDGVVRCFGANDQGQLGQGTFDAPVDGGPPTAHPLPVAVKGIAGARAVAVGSDHACAITGCGTVRCWGKNDVGQLGDGTTNDSALAVEVVAPTPIPP